MKTHILVDLDRCIGCYACEIACKQENHVPEGKKLVEVKKIGPTIVDGRMRMDYYPAMSGCILCPGRGTGPACVEACPTKALKLCDEAEALQLLYGEKRHQISRVP